MSETKKTNMKKRSRTWVWVVVLLLGLVLLSVIFSPSHPSGNTAIIKVQGVISTTSGGFFGGVADSSEIVNLIKQAEQNKRVKAIIIEINSPGGSAVASQEIVDALKSSEKVTVSYIRDAGASGGYWIASATDYIYSSPLSIVGSVGVTAAQLEFAGLLSDYNITYRQLTAGEFKDIGTPLRKLTLEEEQRLQEKLDVMHEYFVNDVSISRNFSDEVIEEIKKADFYVGIQAKELGLVDDFGGRDEAIQYVKQKIGEEPTIVEYTSKKGLFSVLGSVQQTFIPDAMQTTKPVLR